MEYSLGDIVKVSNERCSAIGMIVSVPNMSFYDMYTIAVKPTIRNKVYLRPLVIHNKGYIKLSDESYRSLSFALEDKNTEINLIEKAGKEWKIFKKAHKSWYVSGKLRQCCVCKSKCLVSYMTKIEDKRYACKKCLHIQNYWTKNNEIAGSNTKNGAKYGFELECIPKDNADYDMTLANLLTKRKDIIPTHDGSLPTNGVEFKTPIMCNLKYARGLLSAVSKDWDFSHDKCGQHINISIPELTKGMIKSISQVTALHKPFDILKEYMVAHENETKTVCGRYFTYYAYNGNDYVSHENWINLSHDDRVEFRLSKVSSVSQYIMLAQMWTEMLRICVKNYEDINNGIKPYHEANAIYGEKMIKVFQRYYKKISKMT